MSDIFQEVDEEVRREQLKKLWERYGAYMIALCVLVVAATGGWRAYEWYQAKQAAQAGTAFQAAIDLAGNDAVAVVAPPGAFWPKDARRWPRP